MAAYTDSIVGPVVDGLIAVAGQIDGIGRHYREAPDAAPEDNSVLYPLKNFEIADQTNGRLTYRLTFDVTHVFRRSRLQDNIARVHAFLPGWIDALTAWPNQTLGGKAVEVNLRGGKVASVPWGGQNGIGLVLTVEVLTEQSIRMS